MRGQSGEKASRNSRRKVTLTLIFFLLTVPILRKHCMLHLLHLKWFKLFTHCTTEKWKFVSVWSLCVSQTSRHVFWVLWSSRSWPAPVSSSELSTTFLWPATKTVRTSHTNIFFILVFLCLDAFCVSLTFFFNTQSPIAPSSLLCFEFKFKHKSTFYPLSTKKPHNERGGALQERM